MPSRKEPDASFDELTPEDEAWFRREMEKRAQKKREDEERLRQRCEGRPIFYRLAETNPLDDDCSFDTGTFRYKVGKFPCKACGNDGYCSLFSYPHLDPSELLTPSELKLIDGGAFDLSADYHPPQNPELLGCIRRMEQAWKVPITTGTSFCPVLIEKIGRRHKLDFVLPMWSGCLYASTRALENLQREGFTFDVVDAVSNRTKCASEPFVQVVVPVVAREALPPGVTFCESCKRVSNTKAERPDYFYDTPKAHRMPVFRTLERGTILLSADLVAAANRTGLKGLEMNKSLFPWPAWPDPVPSRPPLEWIRPKLPKRAEQPTRAIKQEIRQARRTKAQKLDYKFATGWIERLRVFSRTVKASGGSSEFNCANNLKPAPLSRIPTPLRILMEACCGMLQFKYAIDIGGQHLSGSLKLDASLLKQQKADCLAWAKETWIADAPEEKVLWANAVPFTALENGDYLALDCRRGLKNPGVIYLSHDDTSHVISPSLGDFLREWEGVGYVGPEDWMVEAFLDAKTGLLNAETESARKTRGLLLSLSKGKNR